MKPCYHYPGRPDLICESNPCSQELEARVKQLEDALGTSRMCDNCAGGIHGLCAGSLRCNCGCRAAPKFIKSYEKPVY